MGKQTEKKRTLTQPYWNKMEYVQYSRDLRRLFTFGINSNNNG